MSDGAANLVEGRDELTGAIKKILSNLKNNRHVVSGDVHNSRADYRGDVSGNDAKYRLILGAWKSDFWQAAIHLRALNGDPIVNGSKHALHFNIRTKHFPGNASAFAKIGDELWLVHSGRVAGQDGRKSPASRDVIEVGGRRYNKVSSLEDGDIFDNILEYHRSRRAPRNTETGSRSQGGGTGSDKGAEGGGARSRSEWEAKHSPLVKKITKALGYLKFKPKSSNQWRPDIYYSRDSLSMLVEVKPTNEQTDIITAIGQCIVYNSTIKASMIVIAAPKAESIAPKLKNVINSNGIKLLDTSQRIKPQITGLLKAHS